MTSSIDLRSIAVDLNSCPTVDNEQTLNPIRIQTTDYSKILRTIAGINVPSVPCAVMCTALDLIFTLITLVLGTTNLSACPAEARVPIYLVVSGTINLASICFTIVASILHSKEKDENIIGFFYVTFSAVTIIICQLMNFIWLILGTVWVFSVLNQVQYDNMNEKHYCQKNVYQYTLISIVLQYIIPIVLCCCKNITLLKN